MQHAHQTVKLSPVYGITIALVSVVLTIIFYVTKLYGNLWMGYLPNLVMFLGVLIAVIHYNKTHHDRTSAMSSFAMGVRTTLLAVVLIIVFQLIFHLVIVNSAGHEMTGEGGAVREDQAGSNNIQQGFWIYLFTNVLFVNLILGLLASMLAAMVFKANQKTTSPADDNSSRQ